MKRNSLTVPAGQYARNTTIDASLGAQGDACYEVWARTNGAVNDAIYLSSVAAGSDLHFLLRCLTYGGGTEARFVVQNGTPIEVNVPQACDDGNWHHIAGCREDLGASVRLTLYYDGIQIGTNTGSESFVGAPADVYIGGVTYGQDGLDGAVDEVRISDTLRYTSNFTPVRRHAPDANTVLLWHFDEGTGSTSEDASGNAYTAELTAGTGWVAEDGFGIAGACTAP